ncbi:MAG: phosphatidylserine decarboxylase family protein [bacterium]
MNNRTFPIAKEGWVFIIPLFLLTVILFFLGIKIFTFLFLGSTIFTLFFFRDPERKIPSGENIFVSPADGKIIQIKKVQEDRDLPQKSLLVSIFMSVFNVHVNRAPCNGVIKDIIYNPGQFLPAFQDKASLLNEQNSVKISSGNQTLLVRQIAGLIARRIVCKVKTGDVIVKGERFGLIRFGSRVDIFLPIETKLNVSIGDKVKGGETVLGELKNKS